jgi:adhesin HecA-like repeat protein
MGLDAVYNAPAATLHFLERARIQGRSVSSTDTAIIPAIASLPGGKIGMFNEGKILVNAKSKPGEVADPKAVEYRGIDIKSGNYVASQNAVFRMEHGGVRSFDFFNDGIFYSPTRLKYHTFGGTVTSWGRGVAEDGIGYEIDSSTPGTLSDSFKPIINGPKKTLKVTSKTGLNIAKPLNWNVDLEVETPTFNGNADLTVRDFKAKTTTFNNTKTLSAKDSIHIDTRDFTNTSGRLQTHGDVQIKADGQFRNTGGGTLEKGKNGSTYYIASGAGYKECKFPPRDIYKPDLGKSGVITGGRYLDIIAGRFDNSFGILNATKRMNIRSLAELCNECGLIYSGGPMVLAGTLLKKAT